MKPKYQEVVDRERRRKNGVNRWRSELRRFGEEVVELVPDELYPEVVRGTRFDPEMINRETELTKRLRKVAPVVPGVNPVAELGRRLAEGIGNGGQSLTEADDPVALILRLQASSPQARRLPGK